MSAKQRLGSLVIGLAISASGPAWAQLTVIDPANYHANLLIDAHALQQIANQVRQMQNEAQMLLRLEQNLRSLGVTIAPDLQRGLGQVSSSLQGASAIPLRLPAAQPAYDQLFPNTVSPALSSQQAQQNATARLQEVYAGARRAALVQAAIADQVDADRQLLADTMARSRSAVGALAAAQAGNELAGLNVKQALALQALLAAQARADTLARASDVASEQEARQRFQAFLGPASAYAAKR